VLPAICKNNVCVFNFLFTYHIFTILFNLLGSWASLWARLADGYNSSSVGINIVPVLL
jgi:hypothetical protein